MNNEPKTLQEAILYFSDTDNCIRYLVERRWPNGVACPTCGRTDVSYIPSRRLWQCRTRHKKCQFSIKVGTIFEDSSIGLDKWLLAMWMLANCKNGVSSYEISRAIGITQKSAWHLLHRIRLAMKDRSGTKIGGEGSEVECDETYLGGKVKNLHMSKRAELGMGPRSNKVIVMGTLDRTSKKVRAEVIHTTSREAMDALVRRNVKFGSTVYTDAHSGYNGLKMRYTHEFVNHVDEYVRGRVHTQGIENFWSLLKRGLNGTYICVEPFHIDRYVDEQAFRYNNRKHVTDRVRFERVVAGAAGHTLPYAKLIGGTKPNDR